jgi:hypothetical protein
MTNKYEKLQGLKALLTEWEQALEPDDPYLKHLRQRIQKVKVELMAMRP